MGTYIGRRLLQMAPLLFGISIILFGIIQAAPGGPEGSLLETGRFIDPQVIENYRKRLGVDKPVPIQYVRWLSAAVTGDLGISFSTTRPVSEMILERLPATLELMGVSFLFAALMAFVLGIYSALRPYSLIDFLGTGFSFLGIGRLFIQAMFARDYPLLMGILLMGSLMVVVFNLVADMLYGVLDPRIRYDG